MRFTEKPSDDPRSNKKSKALSFFFFFRRASKNFKYGMDDLKKKRKKSKAINTW